MGSTGSGVMATKGILLAAHCVVFCLLQMVALSSEQFTVTGLQSPVLATFGRNLELSCQLSPPQDAQHMEIRWFRNFYSQAIHVYRNGKDIYGEIFSKYVERTALLKNDIGKGKVTLRIFNVTVDDDGPYHCFFKDGEFYEEHITEVKVTATSTDIQIYVNSSNIKGVILECYSRDWFPQPHMEWRDSKGAVIPATSKSHSQNENKLFNMTMILFIEASSHWKNVTCYFQNLLTHQEESISIALPGDLFLWKITWITVMSAIPFVLIAFCMAYCVQQDLIHGKTVKKSPPTQHCDEPVPNKSESSCSVRNYLWIKISMVLTISMLASTGFILTLNLDQRVPITDPHFELDTLWLEDTSVILCVLIVFNIKLISIIYFRFYEYIPKGEEGSHKLTILVIVSQLLCFTLSSVMIIFLHMQSRNTVSISDPLISLYNNWILNMEVVLRFLLTIYTTTNIINLWIHKEKWYNELLNYIEDNVWEKLKNPQRRKRNVGGRKDEYTKA